MFGLKRGKGRPESDKPSPGGEPLMSAVLMADESFPTDAFQRELEHADIGQQQPADVHTSQGCLAFGLGDELVAIAPMKAPYPWSDLEGYCETARMWPPDVSPMSLKQHRSHVLITMMGGKSDPVARRLTLTRLTAIAAKQTGVVGVVWPEGTLVHFPPIFIEMTEVIGSSEAPPLYLWVDFRLFRNDDGSFGLFTTGLTALGRMEIEIPTSHMKPGELREWVVGIAYYVLDQGPLLKHGDTIGMTAEQKVRVRHAKSMFHRSGLVLRMEP
jgi:hypothetical protein